MSLTDSKTGLYLTLLTSKYPKKFEDIFPHYYMCVQAYIYSTLLYWEIHIKSFELDNKLYLYTLFTLPKCVEMNNY